MQVNVNLPQSMLSSALDQLVDRIVQERRISRSDQSCLMSWLLAKDNLNAGEQQKVNQLFDGLRSGLIRVID